MITFKNLPDTSTPLSADNLNENFEELDEKITSLDEKTTSLDEKILTNVENIKNNISTLTGKIVVIQKVWENSNVQAGFTAQQITLQADTINANYFFIKYMDFFRETTSRGIINTGLHPWGEKLNLSCNIWSSTNSSINMANRMVQPDTSDKTKMQFGTCRIGYIKGTSCNTLDNNECIIPYQIYAVHVEEVE